MLSPEVMSLHAPSFVQRATGSKGCGMRRQHSRSCLSDPGRHSCLQLCRDPLRCSVMFWSAWRRTKLTQQNDINVSPNQITYHRPIFSAQNWFLGYDAFKSLVAGLDRSLTGRTWLVAEHLTLADVLVAYAMRGYYLLVRGPGSRRHSSLRAHRPCGWQDVAS